MEVLKDKYSITELSEALNITDHALRFYEKEFGLNIPKDSRGRRYYTTEYANIMYQIKVMRDEGLELKAIRKILEDENVISQPDNAAPPYNTQLPSVIEPKTNQISNYDFSVIMNTLDTIKDELFNNLSSEFTSTREYISKELYKSKLEIGACVENSSRKLELKLDRHFQEVDRSITNWREKRNKSFFRRLKRLLGRY